MTKRMDIKEFIEEGFLQEVNRLFFHPLGLALEVIIDNETGEAKLSSIWDCRDDPDGIIFDKVDIGKVHRIHSLWAERAKMRETNLGFVIQPPAG